MQGIFTFYRFVFCLLLFFIFTIKKITRNLYYFLLFLTINYLNYSAIHKSKPYSIYVYTLELIVALIIKSTLFDLKYWFNKRSFLLPYNYFCLESLSITMAEFRSRNSLSVFIAKDINIINNIKWFYVNAHIAVPPRIQVFQTYLKLVLYLINYIHK